MDARLLAWAARVKPRAGWRGDLPRLWLFTDMRRLPDPLGAVAGLPAGRAGVVLRCEGMSAALAVQIAALCRTRRLALSVAGDPALARRLRAGLHLRGGRIPHGLVLPARRLTGSAHDAAEALRCRRAGVRITFLSPLFVTASHPGGTPLGIGRWAALARLAGPGAGALGGVDGARVLRLPPGCVAVGAISARGARRITARGNPATVFQECHVGAPDKVAGM